MAGKTAAEAAVLDQTARKFEEGNQQLQAMLSRLLNELEVLQAAWRGMGANAFHTVKQAWTEDQKRLQAALTETANAIRTSGAQYTSTDMSASDRVAATSRGINLPL